VIVGIYRVELVSVIIPCYNSGATLKKTIDSIKKQSYRNIEIVVVDDGSDCKMTKNFLDSLNGIHLIRQKNKGLASARNAGILFAKGELILPLDSDDWLHPTMIKSLLDVLQSQSGFYCYCDTVLEGERSGLLSKEYNFFEQLFLNQLPYCLLFRKSLWQIVGGYDESMILGYEDWEFNIRLGKAGYFPIHVSQPLFHYRVSKNGMLISKSNLIHGDIWKTIQKKHFELYSIKTILRTWNNWKDKPSVNNLSVYFLLYALHKTLPKKIFSVFFKLMRKK
jgi:glycosyltransferase involved in cell wall biosynthesis